MTRGTNEKPKMSPRTRISQCRRIFFNHKPKPSPTVDGLGRGPANLNQPRHAFKSKFFALCWSCRAMMSPSRRLFAGSEPRRSPCRTGNGAGDGLGLEVLLSPGSSGFEKLESGILEAERTRIAKWLGSGRRISELRPLSGPGSGCRRGDFPTRRDGGVPGRLVTPADLEAPTKEVGVHIS